MTADGSPGNWSSLRALGNIDTERVVGSPFITFGAGDSTPSVAGGNHFKNAAPTSITDLTDGVDGQRVAVVFDGSSSVDFAAGNLRSTVGTPYAPPQYAVMSCLHDGTLWYCEF